MDRDTVYKLGVKSGLLVKGDNWGSRFDQLMKFAALVAAENLKEIERLRGEVEGLRSAYNIVAEDCRNLTEKVIPNIRSEREAVLEDAERYRWLKKENRSTYQSTTRACVTFNIGHDWVKESDLDAAIDAARGNK